MKVKTGTKHFKRGWMKKRGGRKGRSGKEKKKIASEGALVSGKKRAEPR